MTKPTTSIALACSALLAAWPAFAGPPRHGQPIAVLLARPPGMPSGVMFVELKSPTISPTGDVSFLGNIMGPGITTANESAIWTYSNGQLLPTCRKGSQAYQPSNGQTIRTLDRHRIFSNGRLGAIVRAGISEPTQANYYEFCTGSGDSAFVRNVVFTENGLPAQTFARYEFVICDEGTAYVNMDVEPLGSAAFDALVRIPEAGSPQIVIGKTAPSWPGMTPLTPPNGPGWRLMGEVAGTSDVTLRLETYAANQSYRSFWTNVPSNPTRLLAPGETALGLPAGVGFSFENDTIYSASRTGRCAALCHLGGPGVWGDFHNEYAIVSAGPGAPAKLVARSGDQAVGAAPGVQYREFFSVLIGDSGHVMFTANRRGTGVQEGTRAVDERGVWLFDGQTVHAVWLPGWTIPGLPANITINQIQPRGIDASGRAILQAEWWTVGTAQIAKRALLTWDTTRGMSVLAAVGERITLSPTQEYTIEEVDAGNVINSFLPPTITFAADGRFAYWVRADGYSAIMLTNLHTICGRADVAGLGGALNPDGRFTVDDIVAYLSAFLGEDIAHADLVALGGEPNPDGILTSDDLIAFLAMFFAGCQ